MPKVITPSAPVLSPAMEEFLSSGSYETPFVVLDLDVIGDRYDALAEALPVADIFYAVKANPNPAVLGLVAGRGGNFDVASPAEIDMALATGVDPARISFGNTIKKERHIAEAFSKGVRLFAFDSMEELDKLTRQAPGATVFCRILTDGHGADWPLSRKFGCEPAEAQRLLLVAAERGFSVGVSFHVGSQMHDLDAWDRALETVADVAGVLAIAGVPLALVNVGGGFPATYQDEMPSIGSYGDAITSALYARLAPLCGTLLPRVIAEPGRYLVADAGVLQTEVVLTARKHQLDERRWVYLDCGKFGGLAETMDEAIRYRLRTPHDTAVALGDMGTGPVVIAGPTCDSADVLYDKTDYHLPLGLSSGDRIEIFTAGAYTTTYSAVGFNGFAPLAEHVVGTGAPRA